MKDLHHSLEDLLEAGKSQFPLKGKGVGVSSDESACTLTTMHSGYNKKHEGEGVSWHHQGRLKYCKQVYDLSHPLNHHLTVTETKEMPVNINYPVIDRVKNRFGFLPLRWGVIAMNDETDWEREEIAEWASKEISN